MRDVCACGEERAATLASSTGCCATCEGAGAACAKVSAAAGERPAPLLVVGCITIVDVGSFDWCGGSGGGCGVMRRVREPVGGLENERGGDRRGERGIVVMNGEIDGGGRVGFSIRVGCTVPRVAAAGTAAAAGLCVVVTPVGRCSCFVDDANDITGCVRAT